MAPREWAWLFEFKQGPVDADHMPGTLTRDEADELAADLKAEIKAEQFRNGRQ